MESPGQERTGTREVGNRCNGGKLGFPPRRFLAAAAFAVALACVARVRGEDAIKTFDGKYDIRKIHVSVVYFVPRDRTPLPDWQDRVGYYCRRIQQFHAREFQGKSTLATTVYPEPFISSKDSAALRRGDRDFIFFQTLEEVEARLRFGPRKDGVFPILLVLSDINWRELDDFYRVREVDGQFEGQIINQRHFPGAESGGARSLYQPERGVAWGLVSGDGWRVPYSGSDCVVYHEGVGHPIGLPHPEPGDGSVMSLAQYEFWINQTWIEKGQKEKLGLRTKSENTHKDLFSVFTAIPQPLTPKPGEEVALRFTWPTGARLRGLSVRVQTDLFGPWHEIPATVKGAPPELVSLGQFDRPTPVSYRITALLDNGEMTELWGYFQVRKTPAEAPVPRRSAAVAAATTPARWSESIDLVSLIEPKRDQVAGEWTRVDGRLQSNKQYGARIEIPFRPPEEYVLTAVVEPLDEPNGLILGQRMGDRRFLVLVNFRRPGQPDASAMENVDGLNVEGNNTALRETMLAKNRPSVVTCTVRKGSVTVTCDGRQLWSWQGEASRLSLSDYWKTPHDEALFLGAYDCRYRFHRVTLTPISGTGKPLAEEKSSAK